MANVLEKIAAYKRKEVDALKASVSLKKMRAKAARHAAAQGIYRMP